MERASESGIVANLFLNRRTNPVERAARLLYRIRSKLAVHAEPVAIKWTKKPPPVTPAKDIVF
jgi:hypothetical protein